MSKLNFYRPATVALAGSGAALSATSVAITPRSSHKDLEALKSQVVSSSEIMQTNVKNLEEKILKMEQQLGISQNSSFEALKNQVTANSETVQESMKELEEKISKIEKVDQNSKFKELLEDIKRLRDQVTSRYSTIIYRGSRLPGLGGVSQRKK